VTNEPERPASSLGGLLLAQQVNRARLWRGKKELDKAIADYDEYIRLNPKVDAAFMNRANV